MKRLIVLLCALFPLSAQAAFRAGSCGAVASGTGSSVTINSPTGVQLNDVVVLIVLYSTTPTLTLPTGFTDVTNSPHQFNVISQNASGYKMSVATRIATASEPASYSGSFGGSYAWLGVACAWSGRNISAPVTATAVTSAAGTTSPVTINLTGVTAATGDDVLWIPAFSKSYTTAPTWTAPTGYTNRVQGDYNASPLPHFDLASIDNFSGATGTLTGTETGLGGDQNGFVVSLAAASGASCTHSGITSGGAIAVPNGTSGSYRGKTGAFVTPDCSTVQYFQPTVGNFGVN